MAIQTNLNQNFVPMIVNKISTHHIRFSHCTLCIFCCLHKQHLIEKFPWNRFIQRRLTRFRLFTFCVIWLDLDSEVNPFCVQLIAIVFWIKNIFSNVIPHIFLQMTIFIIFMTSIPQYFSCFDGRNYFCCCLFVPFSW